MSLDFRQLGPKNPKCLKSECQIGFQTTLCTRSSKSPNVRNLNALNSEPRLVRNLALFGIRTFGIWTVTEVLISEVQILEAKNGPKSRQTSIQILDTSGFREFGFQTSFNPKIWFSDSHSVCINYFTETQPFQNLTKIMENKLLLC